jgi:PAS domain S-box-containing protein
MAISRETTERIRNLLKDNPRGLSITEIVKHIPINRNTASRYLDTMLVSGQVEVRHFGMAKIYSLAKRLPVSSVLSVSSEYVLQVDNFLRIVSINAPFLALIDSVQQDLRGRKIDTTPLAGLFGSEFARLLGWMSDGLSGIARQGEIHIPGQDRILACRITPTVFFEGQRGVVVLFEDITAQRNDEELLRQSEEKFRMLAGAALDGILICSPDGRILEWNAAMSRLTGIPAERAVGSPVPEHILKKIVPGFGTLEHAAVMRARLRSFLRTLPAEIFSSPVEAEITGPGGRQLTIQSTIFPIQTSRAVLLGAIIRDITERRQMLDEISAREERFRALFNNASDMITLHGFTKDGLPGTFIEVNEVACRRLGYSREELLCMSPRDLIHPSCMETMRSNAGDLRVTGSAMFEIIHVTKDSRMIPVEVRSHVIELKGQRLVLAQVRDLTAEKLAEAAVRESEERLRLALSGSATGMWELDLSTMNGTIDDQAASILGYKKEEIGTHRMDWDALTHPDDVPGISRRLADYLEARTEFFETDHRMRHASGAWIWMSGKGRITRRLPDGTPARISGTLHDITRRREAEEFVKVLARMADSAPASITIVDPDGNFLYANETTFRMHGYTKEEFMQKNLRDIDAPGSAALIAERTRLSLRDSAGEFDVQHITSNGSLLPLHVSAKLMEWGGQKVFVSVAIDQSERIRAQRALLESQERYRAIFKNSADGIIILGIEGTITEVNASACRMTGFLPGDLVGKNGAGIFSKDIAERYLAGIRKVVTTKEPDDRPVTVTSRGGMSRFSIRFSPVFGADGSVVSVAVLAREGDGKRISGSTGRSRKD